MFSSSLTSALRPDPFTGKQNRIAKIEPANKIHDQIRILSDDSATGDCPGGTALFRIRPRKDTENAKKAAANVRIVFS